MRLRAELVVRQAEFLLALDAREDEQSAAARRWCIASAIEPGWLEELCFRGRFGERGVVYDVERDRVVGHGATYYRDLLLKEDSDAAVDPELAAAALVEAVRGKIVAVSRRMKKPPNGWLDWRCYRNTCRSKLGRRWMKGRWLRCWSGPRRGNRSIAELKKAPLAGLLSESLAYPLDRLFEQNAPKAIASADGQRHSIEIYPGRKAGIGGSVAGGIRVDGYTAGCRWASSGGDAFACTNYRSVQITDDLRSFWAGTYFQVRKDLRVRYPKHSWPEDPLTAKPEAKGRRRG